MPTPDPRQILGKLGETLAGDELRRRGYSILAIRHRTRFGEIDIVAERDSPRRGSAGVIKREIAFVEVKARRTMSRGSAVYAITPRKQRRVAAMALDYLASCGRLEDPCQFVVVAIDRIDTPQMTIRVIENAWTMDN